MAARRLSTIAKWVSIKLCWSLRQGVSLGNEDGLQIVADEGKHNDVLLDMI